MCQPERSDEQRSELEWLEERVLSNLRDEIRAMIGLLASKPNQELLGATEFQLRDMCLDVGRGVLEAVLEERKKRGTKGAV